MIILGIDPALNRVGYGILFYDEKKDLITDYRYGVYDILQKDATEQKLNRSYETTRFLIEKYKVDEVAIERAFHNPKRAKGGMLVREAIGALKVAAMQENRPIHSYSPQTVKKTITGSGAAKKIEVALEIAKILNISEFEVKRRFRGKMEKFVLTPNELIEKGLDHVTDALSISYCRLKELKEDWEGAGGSAV